MHALRQPTKSSCLIVNVATTQQHRRRRARQHSLGDDERGRRRGGGGSRSFASNACGDTESSCGVKHSAASWSSGHIDRWECQQRFVEAMLELRDCLQCFTGVRLRHMGLCTFAKPDVQRLKSRRECWRQRQPQELHQSVAARLLPRQRHIISKTKTIARLSSIARARALYSKMSITIAVIHKTSHNNCNDISLRSTSCTRLHLAIPCPQTLHADGLCPSHHHL